VGLFLWASSVEGTLERTEAVDDEGGQPGSNGRPALERTGRNAPSDPETPGSHRVPEALEP
jgi:hypothetical protein